MKRSRLINGTIRAVAPFAGGKRRLAPRIVELLGPHNIFVDSLVGGCSILPAKPRSRSEFLFDLNEDVIVVLQTLQTHGEKVREILNHRQFTKAAFEAARAALECQKKLFDPNELLDPIVRTADLLTLWWMGPGGMAGTTRRPWFAQRHTNTGGDPAKRWGSFQYSLPALCDRLQGCVIKHANALQAARELPDREDLASYWDPPYLSKSFSYVHDFTEHHHRMLARRLNEIKKSRVVVSYYDDGDGKLAELYPPDRWRRIEVAVTKSMASASGESRRAVEVLLVNF